MRTFLGIVAAIGFVAVSACDSPTRPGEPTVYTLSGQVTDSTSRNPVPNVQVGLRTDMNVGMTAVTDAQGRYIFPGITSGGPYPNVSVYVSTDNYRLYTKVVELKHNDVTTHNIVLER
jgi:hypothetical protein